MACGTGFVVPGMEEVQTCGAVAKAEKLAAHKAPGRTGLDAPEVGRPAAAFGGLVDMAQWCSESMGA